MNNLISQVDAGMHYTGEVNAGGYRDPPDWFLEYFGVHSTADSVVRVTQKTALSHTPVWQAVNILAGDVGQLPLHKMVRRGRNIEKDRKHPAEWLFNDEPNPFQNPCEWKEWTMATALLWGNAISLIVPLPGRRMWLLPLSPERTGYIDDPEYGYMVTHRLPNGAEIGPFLPSEVFHLRGLATCGYWGLSAIQVCKNSIGHGMALEQHGNSVFKNGARPSGVLETPNKAPTAEQRREFRDEWDSIHRGAGNANKIAILWGGMKFTPMSMSNDDAQWLESRRLDREYIASVFGLPAFKLNALENSAVRANVEEQNRDYYNTSLSRWLNKIVEESRRKLLTDAERMPGDTQHYFEWTIEAFLRADLKARGEYYSKAVSGEWMTRNEIRQLEGLNPVEGGDELKNPAINPQPAKQDDGPAQDKAKQLIRSRVAALLEIEASRIDRTARTAENFVASATAFYEKFVTLAESNLSDACELAELVGITAQWRRASEEYARDALQNLLAVAGLVTKSGLQEAVSDHAQAIRTRVDDYVDAILGG